MKVVRQVITAEFAFAFNSISFNSIYVLKYAKRLHLAADCADAAAFVAFFFCSIVRDNKGKNIFALICLETSLTWHSFAG